LAIDHGKNLMASLASAVLPHAQATGETAELSAAVIPQATTDPRSYGNQVVN
jgi:hypothetical protein